MGVDVRRQSASDGSGRFKCRPLTSGHAPWFIHTNRFNICNCISTAGQPLFFCCFLISVYTSGPKFDRRTSVDVHSLAWVCHATFRPAPPPPPTPCRVERRISTPGRKKTLTVWLADVLMLRFIVRLNENAASCLSRVTLLHQLCFKTGREKESWEKLFHTD